MSLEENIKKWVILDTKQKKINDELKIIRNEKNLITNNLIKTFENKNINFPIINISDGKLNLSKVKNYNVISYNFLINCFKEYFSLQDEDNCDEKALELLEFIKNKRTYNIISSIKRTYNKQ